jgi:hypothetical protein
LIHHGTVKGLCEALLDAFDGLPSPPLDDVRDLIWVCGRLRTARRELGGDLYRASAFRKLVVVAAKAIVEERVLSRR